MSILSTLLLLFVVLVLSLVIIQHVVVPSLVNYQHGLLGSPEFTIDESRIQGLGLFTKRQRVKDERLFVAINANETVTLIGSKINHCPGKSYSTRAVIPNTYLSTAPDKATGEWWIIAGRNIDAGEELTVDYTHTPDFISKPDPNWKCEL